MVDDQVKNVLLESQIPILSPKIGTLDKEDHPVQITTNKSDCKKSDLEGLDRVGLNAKSDLESLNFETSTKMGTIPKRKQSSILDFGRPSIDLRTQDPLSLASDLPEVLEISSDFKGNINVV